MTLRQGARIHVTAPEVMLADVLTAAIVYYGVPMSDFRSASRARPIVQKRQVAMYVARRMTRLSMPAIAARFGGRDHTTVLHAIRRVEQRLALEPATETQARHLLETETAVRVITEIATATAARRGARLSSTADHDGFEPSLLDSFFDVWTDTA